MSNKNKNNYNKMYNKPVDKAVAEEIAKPAILEPEVQEELVDATPEVEEPVAVPTTKIGAVTCELLNMRCAPNPTADVVMVLSKETNVSIDLAESTDEWYKVDALNGNVGYCMKKFIAVC